MRLTKHEYTKSGHVLLTYETKPWRWLRFFGIKPKIKQYIGECTVWYNYPEFKRCAIWDEVWLADVWVMLEFKRRGGL